MAVECVWLLRPIFLFSAVFLITYPVTYSMSESEALLKLKRSFTNAKTLDSWVPGTVPCRGSVEQWDGIICSNGVVTGLRCRNMGLSGKIDVDALVKLSGLRTMSFSNNSFSGSIPDLNRIGGLRAVYLTGNQFSGEIPPHFFEKMDALRRFWIGNNKFKGLIPPSLFQLPHLNELHLEKNQFTGSIPSFDQPTLVEFNLSNNKLEGEIPVTLSKFNASSFSGNPGLCGKSIGVECKTIVGNVPPPPPTAAKKDDSKKIVAAVITVSLMVVSIAIVLIVRVRRKRKTFEVLEEEKESVGAVEVQVLVSNRKEVDNMSRKASSTRRSSPRGRSKVEGELVMVNDEKGVFGLPDLMKAEAEVLGGNGGLGSSYKAVMADGVTVVVKRMREMNTMGRDGFDAEIRKLGSLKHSNILTPLAYHYKKHEKLLVYEFIPKGSLLYLLHGDHGSSRDEFNWPARLKIVQGIARGIGYLHTELAHLDLPHGNLKSSNILLGPENEPLISEYGFCPLINTAKAAQALFAYKTPETVQSGHISPKCDVYCLGVIIFEILTGKFPNQYLNNGEGGTDVVEWVSSSLSEGKVTELLDPEIASSRNSIGEMEQLLQIGRACTASNPQQRLEMKEALRRIEEIKSDNGSIEGRTLRNGCGDNDKSKRRHASVEDNFDHRISGR